MLKKGVTILLLILFIGSIPLPVSAQEAPNGPWVEEVRYEAEPTEANVVNKMEQGDMDIYFSDLSDADLFRDQVQPSETIDYKTAYGLYFELTLNPSGPEFNNGEFNPFSNPEIREAINWLVDRNYIVDEIMQGLAKPKLLPIVSAFPDYGRLAETAVQLESEYAYDPEMARTVIYEQMLDMGAENIEGQWYYNDEPITLKMLIRNEDQRLQIGQYVADQLETLGFETERMLRSSAEASPIWLFGNPANGGWHVYTGGWITTAVDRDSSGNFAFFYTDLGYPVPLWQAYQNNPTFYEKARRLDISDWDTWEERNSLMRDCANLALEDSNRVFLVDQTPPYIFNRDIQVAFDLSAGPNNPIWARTIRWTDQEGGIIRAGSREVLVDPWNPEAGTDWAYDWQIIGALRDRPIIYNPYTGLPMANRIEEVTVTIQEGLDISSSSEWLTVETQPNIEVPTDAWFGWDTENKEVLTASEGTMAKVKVTINWGDVIGNVQWHDGSMFSLADLIMTWALDFEQADPDSVFYDEGTVSDFETYRDTFRGMRVVSESPLVMEFYTNYTNREAELLLTSSTVLARPGDDRWRWPMAPWHGIAMGMVTEENEQLAFSPDKADKLGVEWMNYIGGPSLSIFEDTLEDLVTDPYIPFGDFGAEYISENEAQQRYQNLQNWYNDKGHFWVGTGPFYLEQVDFTGHSAVIRANRDYTYKADRWAFLSEPPIPQTTVSMPDNVVPGLESTFMLDITRDGEPYPNERINFVKYLVLDSAGNLLTSGEAQATAEGEWSVNLSTEETAMMTAGSYELMTFALSMDVGLPGTSETPFVVIPAVSYFQSLLSQTQSELQAEIDDLESSIQQNQETLTELQNRIQGGATMISYAAIAVAIIAILVAVYAMMQK
jgi:peptide/nickel transport system substrate-binding protein